jgi:hypothetical protein
MLPTWQAGPVVPVYAPFNYDYLSVTHPQSIHAALESGRTVITEAYGLPDESNPEEVAEAEAWYDWYSNYVPPDEDASEPLSDIYYPIIASLDSVRIDLQQDDRETGKNSRSLYSSMPVETNRWSSTIQLAFLQPHGSGEM